MTFICERLADFAISISADNLPDEATAAAETAILDTLAAVLGGVPTDNARNSRDAARRIFGPGSSPIWFAPAPGAHGLGALFSNCAAASALDIDDGHRGASGHPGAAIVSAVLTAAVDQPPDGRKLIAAIVVGYDIALRVASARRRSPTMSFASGIWTGYGVAAALGWLRGLDTTQLANAIAIAGVEAPGSTPQGDCMASSVKGSSPWSTVTAALAVERAACGATGPIDILDRDHAFDPHPLVADLGKRWLITETYLKPYAACRYTHGVIDAIDLIRGRMEQLLRPDANIVVEIFPEAQRLPNDRRPSSLEAAQFSLPFTTALAALRGTQAFLPMGPECLSDEGVLELSERVEVIYSSDFVGAFPARTPARVRVEAGGVVETETVLTPLGDTDNPMSADQIERKLRTLGRWRLDAEGARALLESVTMLRTGEAAPLLRELSRHAHVTTSKPSTAR